MQLKEQIPGCTPGVSNGLHFPLICYWDICGLFAKARWRASQKLNKKDVVLYSAPTCLKRNLFHPFHSVFFPLDISPFVGRVRSITTATTRDRRREKVSWTEAAFFSSSPHSSVLGSSNLFAQSCRSRGLNWGVECAAQSSKAATLNNSDKDFLRLCFILNLSWYFLFHSFAPNISFIALAEDLMVDLSASFVLPVYSNTYRKINAGSLGFKEGHTQIRFRYRPQWSMVQATTGTIFSPISS